MERHLVAALVHPPVAIFELGCVTELFGLERPELLSSWYDFAVCALRPGPLSSSGGIKINVPNGLELIERANTIVVPCWDPQSRPPQRLVAAVRRSHARGARLLSICSGAFLLAECGLLDGRRATTHWRYARELKRRFPQIEVLPDLLYADESQIVTSAGSAAGLDMLLHIIRKDHGPEICNIVAQRLVLSPHREGDQVQRVARPVSPENDSRLPKLIEWMRVNAINDLCVTALAKRVAMSPRSFHRHFRATTGMSPHQWLLRERLAIARELLKEDRLSIEHVATKSGFGSPEAFRRQFRRSLGTSPTAYRRALLDRTRSNPPLKNDSDAESAGQRSSKSQAAAEPMQCAAPALLS